MTTKASDITGVTMVGDNMLVQEEDVQAVPIRTALGEFLAFLKKCQQNSPVLLVGHNINMLDSNVIIHALKNCDLLPDFDNTTFIA